MLAKLAVLQEGGSCAATTGTTAEWLEHWLVQVERQVEQSTHELMTPVGVRVWPRLCGWLKNTKTLKNTTA